MSLPRRLAGFLGDSSWAVCRLRPLREWALEAVYGRRGVVRGVNGVPFRSMPRYRWYFAADYDAPVADYFRSRITPGAVCVSVGANLGVYPLQFAHWSGPTGKVFAFEPNPETAAGLRHHIAMNRLTDRVRVVEAAVSDRPGEASFYAAGLDGMSRLGAPNQMLDAPVRAVTVPVVTLDQYCASEGIRPDAVMMDVEGFEIAALRGAAGILGRDSPPTVVVELHPNAWAVAGTDRSDLERLLSGYDLRAVPLSGQSDPLGEYGHVALVRTAG